MSEQVMRQNTMLLRDVDAEFQRKASGLARFLSLTSLICVLTVVPEAALAATLPEYSGDTWVQLLSSSPIAAALAWAMTLNARREKERDEVRVKLEELSIKRQEEVGEVARNLQVEIGKLAVSQSSLANAISGLERFLISRRGNES